MLPTATESCVSSAFAFAAGGGISWKELSASRSGRAQGGGQERVFQVGRGLCSSQKCPYIPAEQCCVVVFSQRAGVFHLLRESLVKSFPLRRGNCTGSSCLY